MLLHAQTHYFQPNMSKVKSHTVMQKTAKNRFLLHHGDIHDKSYAAENNAIRKERKCAKLISKKESGG